EREKPRASRGDAPRVAAPPRLTARDRGRARDPPADSPLPPPSAEGALRAGDGRPRAPLRARARAALPAREGRGANAAVARPSSSAGAPSTLRRAPASRTRWRDWVTCPMGYKQ